MSNDDSILNYFTPDAVAIYVGAHPDDEHTIGPLLARAADVCCKVTVACFTRGESGWNLHREDLTQTLAQMREKEFMAAMKVLGCHGIMFDYINGTSTAHPQGLAVLEREDAAAKRWHAPGGRDSLDDIRARWTRQAGDPVQRLVELFNRERPTVVMVFDPVKGYTNHDEHVAVSLATTEAVKKYNATADRPAALFYSYSPSNDLPEAERIFSSALTSLGNKDYRAIADQSQMCYESQYGTRGSADAEKYMFRWHDQQLMLKAEV